MKALAIMLKVVGYLWLAITVAVLFGGYVGVWMKGGLAAVKEALRPTNMMNWLLTMMIWRPGSARLAAMPAS